MSVVVIVGVYERCIVNVLVSMHTARMSQTNSG